MFVAEDSYVLCEAILNSIYMAIGGLGCLGNSGANMDARSFSDIAYRELIVLYKEHKFACKGIWIWMSNRISPEWSRLVSLEKCSSCF